ncbi:MAG: mandelate racemase/muconate lactonizing enzyme family protein [Candidatus Latescibacteria bacterium]|jgi:galactonate dehydratase|nr:mandelate racemase/muconate lactonizing enzyme family protein [Candidatus Latescibacterota bacterium]
MKITDVTVQLVQSDCGRKWTNVRVHTDEGLTGIGEGTYSHKETVVRAMVEDLKAHIIGRDPMDAEGIYHELYAGARTGYRTGGIMFTSAISGIDQALWDLKGRALNVPVCALLGGPREARVPVYSHFGGRDIPSMVDSAQKMLDEGFNAIKSGISIAESKGPKITREQLRNIDAKYEALREAVGPDIEIMDDPHALFDPPTALEIARLLEPYRLLFFEEPTIPEDPEGYARVRQGTATPIAGSERLTSKHRYNDFFKAGAVDVAQPDIVYIGGITEMKKVAAHAETYQVVIAPHNTKGPVGIMAAAHVMAAIPNALIQEFIAPSRIPWRNEVLVDPLVVEDSCLVIADRPGLGIEFDEEALKPHVVE